MNLSMNLARNNQFEFLNKSPTYIALLGFAESCSIHNTVLAMQVGKSLAKHDLGLAVGNTKGTFHHALIAANTTGGKTLAILEPNQLTWINYALDSIERTPSQKAKHALIAQRVSAGILIGGGKGSKHLMGNLLSFGKPVAAIKDSGGIVDNHEIGNIPLYEKVDDAIKYLLKHINQKAA
jgi:SLOG cluster4 family